MPDACENCGCAISYGAGRYCRQCYRRRAAVRKLFMAGNRRHGWFVKEVQMMLDNFAWNEVNGKIFGHSKEGTGFTVEFCESERRNDGTA